MKIFALQLCCLIAAGNDVTEPIKASTVNVLDSDTVPTISLPASDPDAAVNDALSNISTLLLNPNVVIGLSDLVQHLVDLTYADIIWNKYWNMKFWPSSPSQVTVDINPVIKQRVPRGIVTQETRQVVYRTVTRCVNPSDHPIACEVPGFNYTIDQEIHMTAVEGLRQDEGITLPVGIWIESLNHPYGWDWPVSEEDILLIGEPLENIQPHTVEMVPPHHSIRIESEVEKILVSGEAVVDVTIGTERSDALEWYITGCAVPYESSTSCRLHTIGPFTPELVSAQLSPTARAALCVHRELSQCLLTIGDDGKVHSNVRSRFAAVPSSRIHRRVWFEEPGRTDWLSNITEIFPAAQPILQLNAII